MKRIIVFLVCIIFCNTQGIFAQITSKVDERFELTSIVFRLAGAEEYGQCGVPAYAKDIDMYFASMKQHPIISFIKQVRTTNDISYNAVSSSTALIEIENGNVRLKPEYALSDITTYESRWSEVLFEKYLSLLNDFYRQSKFNDFFEQHNTLYNAASSQMDEVLATLYSEWFSSFFGADIQIPKIYISLCNGPSNYALPNNLPLSSFGVLIGSGANDKGDPVFTSAVLPIIIHELVHCYANPLIAENWQEIKPAAETIYPLVKQQMVKLAYENSHTVIGEWLTNLFMLMYFQETKPNLVAAYSASLQEQGFIWTDRAVEFMHHFYNDRALYNTIDNFMPQIVGFLNFVASHLDQICIEFSNRRPYIINTYPAIGSSINPNSHIQQIIITFSEPMNTEAHGLRPCNQPDITIPPLTGSFGWQNPYTYAIGLKPDSMQPGEIYGISLPGGNFFSAKGYSMGENINLFFKTAEDK